MPNTGGLHTSTEYGGIHGELLQNMGASVGNSCIIYVGGGGGLLGNSKGSPKGAAADAVSAKETAISDRA